MWSTSMSSCPSTSSHSFDFSVLDCWSEWEWDLDQSKWWNSSRFDELAMVSGWVVSDPHEVNLQSVSWIHQQIWISVAHLTQWTFSWVLLEVLDQLRSILKWIHSNFFESSLLMMTTLPKIPSVLTKRNLNFNGHMLSVFHSNLNFEVWSLNECLWILLQENSVKIWDFNE